MSLFICSKENGRGKTTLAHYLAYVLVWPFCRKENYDRRRTYAFANAHSIFEGKSEDSAAWKSTLLVLDDLGSEDRSSSWRKENVVSTLHKLLHYRRNKKLPTIITSNYTPASLSAFYEKLVDSLLEVRPEGAIGGQLFRQVEVGGAEDFRLIQETSEWPE